MTADTNQLRERGFGNKVGFGRVPAVLIVDFVKAFTDPQSPLGAVVDDQIAAANCLIDAAHRSGVPVFFSTIAYSEDDLSDAGVWSSKIAGLTHLRRDSANVAQDERLHLYPGDTLIHKKHASCFFQTNLHERLQRLGVDTLIVAGCSTSGCVRASVVDACQLGFRTIVAQEAVADRSVDAHRQSLMDIEMKYGDVQSLESILDYLA